MYPGPMLTAATHNDEVTGVTEKGAVTMRARAPGLSGLASRLHGPAMTSTAELTSPSSANTPQLGVIDSDYTLEHKYTRTDGRIYLSGVQALVRLPLMQRLRDQAAGLNTAGFISGYRGSPLGGFDLELWRARKHLEAAGVKFTPGLNEDLGANDGGHAADQPVPRRQGRWRVFHVVRQGSGRGLLRRRVQARQRGRHVEVRRRAGAGGGRSQLPQLHPAARLGGRIKSA